MARDAAEFKRPISQCRQRCGGADAARWKVAQRGAGCCSHRVMTQLVQGVQHAGQGPSLKRTRLALGDGVRQRAPVFGLHASLYPLQRVQRPAAAGGQQHIGLGHALCGQPGLGLRQRGCGQPQVLAAAAHGGQHQRGVGAAEHDARAWRWLFQRLQQRVGGLQVQRFSWVQHHHLAAAPGAGLEDPVDDAADLVDADLLARLALAVFAVSLVVNAQPVVLASQDFGHQHLQIGVQV